jgi:sodium pump decarboxylase gamma subunit
MNFAYDIVVTVTGVVLVFFILVLLMLIILFEGKVFDLLDAKKRAKVEAAHAQAAGKPATAPAAAVQPAGPDVEEGIPGDVVAAIAAAIAALGDGKYVLRAVRRAGNDSGRSVWGKAGTSDTTAPF